MIAFDLGYPSHDYETDRAGYRGTSLQEFFAAFPTDDACLEHMFEMRFLVEGCPKCGGFGEWYRLDGLRSFHCQACHANRSPTADTLMHNTRIPLQLWFYAMLHFANSAHGLSRTFLARHLGLADYPAFTMARRIRYQMAALDDEKKLGGPLCPVFIRLETIRPIIRRGKRKHGSARILILNDGKQVRTAVIGHSKPNYIRHAVFAKAHRDSFFITNCASTFRIFDSYLMKPKVVFQPDYLGARTALPKVHYGFLRYMCFMLQVQYMSVSYHRLWLYLKEAEFRYSRRERSKDTFWDLTGRFPNLNQQSKLTLEQNNNFGIGARK